MKISMVLFGLAAAAAALTVQERQNDVPDCVDGEGNGERYSDGKSFKNRHGGLRNAE